MSEVRVMQKKGAPRGEYAPSGGTRDITRGYISTTGLLPFNDPVLNRAEEYSILNRGHQNLRIFEVIARDDQVAASYNQLIHKITAAPLSVQPGGERKIDQKAAKSLRSQLEKNAFGTVTEKMAYGDLFGFSFAEFMWKRGESDRVEIDIIKVRNRRRFKFTPQLEPRLLTWGNAYNGIKLPDRKFWYLNLGGHDDDNPYGQGTASLLYWLVFFKRAADKYWSKYLEKYGRPTGLTRYPEGATPEQRDLSAQIAADLGDYDGIAIPHWMTAEFLQAVGSGAASYESYIDHKNAAISKVILGQTMTTDDGSSRSQAEVHENVELAIAQSLSDAISESFNKGPARWLTDWNYPGAAYPKISRDLSPPANLKDTSERDRVLTEMGYPPTQAYIESTYGDGFAPPESGEATGLNGAQVQAIVDIVTQVSQGIISTKAARELVVLAVPTVSEDQAERLIEEPIEEPTVTDEPEPEPIAPESLPELDEVSGLFSEVEFAGKKRNCVKGVSCGNTCISALKICRKTPSEAQRRRAEELRAAVGAQATTGQPSDAFEFKDETELGSPIGQGAQGKVYLGDGAVIKYMVPGAEMGEAEISASQLMSDAGVGPRIIATSSNERGVDKMAMEYLDGYEDYSNVFIDPELQRTTITNTFAQVQAMHEANVTHGDMHNGNVMINSAGDVRIIDYGYAEVGEITAKNQLTESIQVLTNGQFIERGMPEKDALDPVINKYARMNIPRMTQEEAKETERQLWTEVNSTLSTLPITTTGGLIPTSGGLDLSDYDDLFDDDDDPFNELFNR